MSNPHPQAPILADHRGEGRRLTLADGHPNPLGAALAELARAAGPHAPALLAALARAPTGEPAHASSREHAAWIYLAHEDGSLECRRIPTPGRPAATISRTAPATQEPLDTRRHYR